MQYTKAQTDKDLTCELELGYGLTERIGVEILVPIFFINKENDERSRGIGDMIFNVEYTLFNTEAHRALCMAGLKVPTGDPTLTPVTGTGTFDFALQVSFTHSSDYWYAAADADALLSTKRKGRKPGNEYLYELVFGRIFTLKEEPNSQLFINLDLLGTFQEQDRCDGLIDEDSGGNVIFLGPLISWSHKNILLEFLFQLPIGQYLFGKQPSFDYTTFISLSVTF